jgi:hypothetical protein
VERTPGANLSGDWLVHFNHRIDHCSYIATTANHWADDIAHAELVGDSQTVRVTIWNERDRFTEDATVSLAIFC